ncbi:hypothetical protein J5491_03005 [Candidatus Saccharibacteria bacterium]|nr:hypothetical protein [Candidatus Saccharibacteria bacterium]
MDSHIGVKGGSVSLHFKIILVILGLVIVGLVIGIVVVTSGGGNNTDDDLLPGDYVLPDELQEDNLSSSDQVMKKVIIMSQSPNTTYNDIEDYYDKVISDAVSSGDHYLAMNVTVQKASYIADIEEDCEKAMNYANSIDTSPYSDEELQFLVSHLFSTLDCEGELMEEL